MVVRQLHPARNLRLYVYCSLSGTSYHCCGTDMPLIIPFTAEHWDQASVFQAIKPISKCGSKHCNLRF